MSFKERLEAKLSPHLMSDADAQARIAEAQAGAGEMEVEQRDRLEKLGQIADSTVVLKPQESQEISAVEHTRIPFEGRTEHIKPFDPDPNSHVVNVRIEKAA